MVVNRPPLSLKLYDEPKGNFILPSGDVLFDSVDKVFGELCVVVILSGVGSDGARGARTIEAGGGAVFVESPGKSSSPSMPQTFICDGE
jgi:two-component system, chemotaxis family, protein-glutamate methylesterase/glutaminase